MPDLPPACIGCLQPLTKHCPKSPTCDWWVCGRCWVQGVPGTEKRQGRWIKCPHLKGYQR